MKERPVILAVSIAASGVCTKQRKARRPVLESTANIPVAQRGKEISVCVGGKVSDIRWTKGFMKLRKIKARVGMGRGDMEVVSSSLDL